MVVTRAPINARPDHASLYADHYLALVRLAVQLVDDLETAEDVVLDVFASWPADSSPDDALRYLRAAVMNRSRSALRRRRTARAFGRHPAVKLSAEPADAELLRSERSRVVLADIDRLPRRQREVVILRYHEDLAIGEIAAVLGIRASAVPTSLSRARATLATLLGDDHHDY
jgi:RNA polymerase sigma factor (sigma-70 family)